MNESSKKVNLHLLGSYWTKLYLKESKKTEEEQYSVRVVPSTIMEYMHAKTPMFGHGFKPKDLG